MLTQRFAKIVCSSYERSIVHLKLTFGIHKGLGERGKHMDGIPQMRNSLSAKFLLIVGYEINVHKIQYYH